MGVTTAGIYQVHGREWRWSILYTRISEFVPLPLPRTSRRNRTRGLRRSDVPLRHIGTFERGAPHRAPVAGGGPRSKSLLVSSSLPHPSFGHPLPLGEGLGCQAKR